ncbi:MAG: aminotransferase class I/II-fold pyridoxal phosphate-dependent enzyme [Pseudomonadota bacterium]
MRISRRIAGLNGGGSDGWEILYRARALKAAGKPVLDLTVGDHDRITPDLILDEMYRSAKGGRTGYADVPGLPKLRAAVAERVATRTGVATEAENVLVVPGGQAGLFAAFMGVLDPGETALFVDPYYATYPGTIRAASGVPHAITARAEAGFQLEASDLDAAPDARAILINTPNNPTGAVYSEATVRAVTEFAEVRDLWIISDEVYDGQIWDGAHLSPRALVPERVLVVGSLSKSHVMTGSRLGWVAGPAEMIGPLANLATNTTYGVAGYIQDAGLEALLKGDAVEAEVAATYRARRDLALSLLQGSNSVRPVPSGGAMYVMLDIRSTGLSGDAFAEQLLDAHQIAVMPGESFGRAAAGHVRVALTANRETLSAALAELVRFAEEIRDAA